MFIVTSILHSTLFSLIVSIYYHFSRVYPDADAELEDVLIRRSQLQEEKIPLRYMFSRFKQHWCYTFVVINENRQQLPQTEAFALCIMATVNT
jgi:hypothetical protein